MTKPEIKIIHLADVHLGYRRYTKLDKNGVNQREVDVAASFREAITRIIARKPNIVIIAGDLFHSVRPSNATVTFCFRELRRLSVGVKCPIVIAAGNHETPKRNDTGSILQLFSEIENVFVADLKAERFTFKDMGVSVFCLPHAALLTPGEIEVRALDEVPTNILVTHAQVDNWVSDFGGVECALARFSPHEWDYIALGHVHIYKNISLNASYSGSTEHTSASIWSEASTNKGFLEVVLPECKRTFHSLTSPREVLVLDPIISKGDSPEELVSRIEESLSVVPGGIDGKIIRLEVRDIPREVYRLLDHKKLRQLRNKALHLSLEFHPPEEGFRQHATLTRGRHGLKEDLSVFASQYDGTVSSPEALHNLILRFLARVEGEEEARS